MEGGVRRSSVVVGRQADLERLRRVVQAASAGATGFVVLTGEGGIGKTRLLHEAVLDARRQGLAVLVGRASVVTGTSFGLVGEALRSWLRREPPAWGEASLYARGLQLIVPEWPVKDAPGGLTDSQLRLLAFEGLVALLASIAEGGGLLLAVDDVHAADDESLEALRYVASSVLPGVAIVAATRLGERPLVDHLVRTLDQQGLAAAWPVQALDSTEVRDLLASLLGTAPPEAFVAEVQGRADGVPLFVEEILDAHLRAGSLAVDAGGVRWRGGSRVVPLSVAALVATRLDRLTRAERDVITAAAVAGAGEMDLLVTVAGQSHETVGRALASAVDAGLLETVGGRLEFRHAVVGDAVRDHALPHSVQAMHTRAAAALAGRKPDDSVLERIAAHLTAAGDHDGAARALVEAASSSRRVHALLRAEALAERARQLARSPELIEAADDERAAALAALGRWGEALDIDRATTGRSGHATQRWARMARCALDGRLLDVARELAEQAAGERGRSAFLEVTVGRLALAVGDTATALDCATTAIDAAGDDVATACAGYDLGARAHSIAGRSEEAAAAWLAEQDVAARAGLTAERLRALVSMAELELFAAEPPRRMVEAVEVARQAGALVEQVWGQLNLSIARSVQGDPREGARLADDAAELCRRHHLDLLPYVLMARLGAAHILGDPAFEALLAEARTLGGGSTDAVVHTSGIAGDHYLQVGEYERAVVEHRRVTEAMLAQPDSIPSPCPYWLVLALEAAGREAEALEALDVARRRPDGFRWPSSSTILAVAEAVLAGDAAGVDTALASAPARLPFELALARVLAAEILGGPYRTRWLREALDLYEAHDGTLAVDRVRRLLRDAGASVPRRRAATVPHHLIASGVTAREAEVLSLLTDGLSNAAISDRLFLSVRTVESHVSSLLAKLGVASRAELAATRPEGRRAARSREGS